MKSATAFHSLNRIPNLNNWKVQLTLRYILLATITEIDRRITILNRKTKKGKDKTLFKS